MHTMQPPGGHAAVNRFVAQSQPMQLHDRGHTMLPGGDFGEPSVSVGDFLARHKG
jgi:hypothetical protein